MKYKVLFVGVDCDVSRMIFHALKEKWDIKKVVFEEPVSWRQKMKFRLKKLGFFSVVGQLLFKVFGTFLLVPFSQRRKQEILEQYGYRIEAIPEALIIQLPDVHGGDWISLLSTYSPDFILINGTRILKKKLLDAFTVPVINIHAGITPMYRGVHGGYWSLANKDKLNFGATIHLVDPGVDTGPILRRIYASPVKDDNFYTYPYLQFAEALTQLDAVVHDYMNHSQTAEHMDVKPVVSKLWYYPTLFEYIYFRITQGIK